jgi:hypothetical protein
MARRLINLPVRTEAILGKVERGELAVHDPQLAGQVRFKAGKGHPESRQGLIFRAFLLSGVALVLAGQVPWAACCWLVRG